MIHNEKRFPGRTRFLFLLLYLACLLLWLPHDVVSVTSPLLEAREVNAVNASWDLGSPEVARRGNGIFKASQKRRRSWHVVVILQNVSLQTS